MSLHTDQNMATVPAWGEAPPEKWYRVRISKVEEGESETKNPIVNLVMKIQDEGPQFGQPLFDIPSLQSHALAKLKAYYTAVGYQPGPEGHDPVNLLDKELWVMVTHEVYQGQTRAKIAPWNIRSLQQGPGQV